MMNDIPSNKLLKVTSLLCLAFFINVYFLYSSCLNLFQRDAMVWNYIRVNIGHKYYEYMTYDSVYDLHHISISHLSSYSQSILPNWNSFQFSPMSSMLSSSPVLIQQPQQEEKQQSQLVIPTGQIQNLYTIRRRSYPKAPPEVINHSITIKVTQNATPKKIKSANSSYTGPYSQSFIKEAVKFYEATSSLFKVNAPVVSIRGSMSSGTNWLRSLFRQNCKGVPYVIDTTPLGSIAYDNSGFYPNKLEFDADALYGWKHGLIHEAELNMLRENPNHSIVVIVRNAANWLLSMQRMARSGALPALRYSSDLSTFQKRSFDHRCPQDMPGSTMQRYYVAVSDLSSVPTFEFMISSSFTACDKYSQREENIIKARTRDYKNWFNAMKILPKQIKIVKYEELKENPYKVFNDLVQTLPGNEGKLNFKDFCEYHEDTFDPVRGYAKYGEIGHNAGAVMRGNRNIKTFEDIKQYDEMELCNKFFRDPQGTTEYKNLLLNLDVEFEKEAFGFQYPTSFPGTPCNERTEKQQFLIN